MLKDSPVAVILPSTDLERTKDFYQNKLGLTLAEPQTDEMLKFTAGLGSTIVIYKKSEGSKAEHTVAGFEVDDLGKVMEDLRSRGVKFEDYDLPGLKTVDGVMDWGGGRSAWFTDPDGSIIAIDESSKQ